VGDHWLLVDLGCRANVSACKVVGAAPGDSTTLSGRNVSAVAEMSRNDAAISAGNWSYSLDSSSLGGGMHTIQVRAYDGKEYSDAAWRDITVPVPAARHRN
jgi:hypothetical protein